MITHYLETWGGKELLKKHSLDEMGIWQIYGEDPNCDFGGHHLTPLLETVTGTLQEAIDYGVGLPGFWQWGFGGHFRLIQPTPINPALLKQKRIQELKKIIQDAQEELNSL